MTTTPLLTLAIDAHKGGDFPRAEQLYREVLRTDPAQGVAWYLLGGACDSQGKHDQAEECLRHACRLLPQHAGAANHLGTVLARQQKVDEAIGWFRRAIDLDQRLIDAMLNLGHALTAAGRPDEALTHYREAMRRQPDHPAAVYQMGLLLLGQGQFSRAAACFEQTLRLAPNHVEAHLNRGLALLSQGKLDDAETCYRHGLRLRPDSAAGHNKLGDLLLRQGRTEEAVASFRAAVHHQADFSLAHSNLLLCLNHSATIDRAALFAEHRRWAALHAAPLAGLALPPVDRATDRPLRIGYVSGDFRDHVVAGFIGPVLAAHDRSRFKVYCYADVPHPDAVTARLQGLADEWRSLVGLSDDEAARQIRGDRIDVLVDLAGHTARNRLLVFARRAAPVQAAVFGYPNTTGLTTMDYRISDAQADPPGTTEAYHTEQLLRLPTVAWCYQPPEPCPDVNPLPAQQTGTISFGSFNKAAKLSASTLATWAQILLALPGSRLLLLAGESGQGKQRLADAFAVHGLGPDRVELLDGRPRFAYLQLYRAIDLCLDPFPYNGGVTTCDALWMGAPVVSLAGDAYVSRQGVSLLSCLGLHDLIAPTVEGYVETALRWAADLDRLARLRAELRERMRTSPLVDAVRYTRNLEAAFHKAVSEPRP